MLFVGCVVLVIANLYQKWLLQLPPLKLNTSHYLYTLKVLAFWWEIEILTILTYQPQKLIVL